MRSFAQWSVRLRIIVLVVTLLALALTLWLVRSILEPLIIAAFIAYLINPAVNFLVSRTRMLRKSSVALVYLLTLVVMIGTPATATSLLFDEFSGIVKDLLSQYDRLVALLQRPLALPGITLDLNQLAGQLAQFRSTFLTTLPDKALQWVGPTSLGALWVVVILVAVYYFLAEWPRLRDGFMQSFPEAYRPELEELYSRVSRIWMGYLRGQLLLMLIVAVAFSIAWSVLGIPGALVLGIIAGFFTLVPDVGPFLAAMLAILVALLEGSRWNWMPASTLVVALITLAVYLILIAIKNFYVRPVVMGRSVHMHEALVLISILLATVLWGILGALLIVPVLASVSVIFDYLRRRILGMEPFPPLDPFIKQEQPVRSPAGRERIVALKYRILRRRKG